MTVSMHKTLAALKLPTQVPALLGIAEAIVAAMTGNPSFPAPSPSLAAVTAALADLEDAEVATRTRTRGTVAVRNQKRAALVGLLVRLKAYVQGVADEDPEHATTLIESAGMRVKKSAAPAKADFEVRPGAVSGSVRMAARAAGDRASYQWAWSPDGGRTWRSAPATLQARTVLSGLPSGSTCSFRVRTVTKTGETDWCEPVCVLVR
jgi:hypothetical protein